MQLLHEAEALLRAAGYRTARNADSDETFNFEDDTVLGFVTVHSSVADLVDKWRERQDTFLRKNASLLRRDLSKAWNAYAVFLTTAPSEHEGGALSEIESDVNATRKIARYGLLSRADVNRALSPLLPLALDGVSTVEESADQELLQRLDEQERALFKLMGSEPIDEARIASLLFENVT